MLPSLLLAVSTLSIGAQSRRLQNFENLVTFGDSYTDESRLLYFIEHGHGPPAGELTPPGIPITIGGVPWGRQVANMTGVKYYNYAVSGAMCSNNITSHWFDPIKAVNPPVQGYELPSFEADLAFPKLYPDRHADNTVYALWIGTNDLGADGFLRDRNVQGTSIPTFVDCVWETFDRIYKTGGRHFVLLNQVPLEKSPMYASPANGGTMDNQYWKNKTQYNTTEYEYKMFEYTRSVNVMFDQGMAFHLLVKNRWPGATLSLFDVHSLFLAMYATPERYLTPPANVTAPYKSCGPDGECQESKFPKSSFLWNDSLHPSQRTNKFVAEEFIKVINRASQYGTTYGC